MRILVTGSRGPLGIAIQRIENEIRPTSQICFTHSQILDLLDFSKVVNFFEEFRPELVIHLAARSGGAQINRTHPTRAFEDNIFMASNVLRAGAYVDTERFILTSSTSAYPFRREIPASESHFFEGPPSESDKYYAYSKRLIETMAQAYRREFGMKIWVPVVNGIAGAGMNFREEKSVMLAGIIKRFFTQYHSAERNEKYIVFGDGTPLREYTYSLDLARAIRWLIYSEEEPTLINIGNSESRTILEYAKLVASKIGIDLDLVHPEKAITSGEKNYNQTTDNSLFLTKSGFQYSPIEVAISEAVDYFAVTHGHDYL